MSKRAERRFHKQRMRSHAKKVFYFLDKKWILRMADNLCMCSQYCCGNPRKWFKEKTRQEMKANVDFQEELDNVD
tara:strand:- start:43 stop:267 length:225 start_codon:yes stop_codon:yes gene_type:complete